MDYIRLKDVYKTMKGTQVLKGVNLTVEQGDIVGIRGINGSGKTMVLRAIAGLIRVDGSVEIGGKKMEPGECPKDIGGKLRAYVIAGIFAGIYRKEKPAVIGNAARGSNRRRY